MIPAKFKSDWIAALRSGKYQQARHRLKKVNALCCLNVGYKVLTGEAAAANNESQLIGKHLGLSPEETDELIDLNDCECRSFAEIADYIEQNL